MIYTSIYIDINAWRYINICRFIYTDINRSKYVENLDIIRCRYIDVNVDIGPLIYIHINLSVCVYGDISAFIAVNKLKYIHINRLSGYLGSIPGYEGAGA
jgi:hypothetical protein